MKTLARIAISPLAATVALALSLASGTGLPQTARAQETEAASPTLSSPLASQRRARDGFMGVRDYSAALGPAQTIVDEQREQREPEYPADLAALGLIQGELRDTEKAEANLVAAIEIVATAEGEYSPTLIDYYHGLGRSYIRGGEYQQALASLEQAQHISQRTLGLFNVEQSIVLDDITTAHLGLGNTVAAQNVQLERLENAVRRFGADDPRVIPFRYTLGKYFERSRLPESAREQYAEVLKSQEGRLGGTDASLLTPLREITSIDLLVTQTADSANRDRLAAVLEQNPNTTAIDRGLTLAVLGDWATVAGDAASAGMYYRQAWEALASDGSIDVARQFSAPTMIDFIAPLNSVDRSERSRPYTWAAIVLEFTVSAEGLPSDVRVVTRDPQTATLQSRYSRRTRETHFRPRLVDGVPVATTHVRATHYVRRYVNRDEEEEG